MTKLQEAEHLRTTGNRAFQHQAYREAIEAYDAALVQGVEDGTFNAVIITNRAAARHALGEYLHAIVDCYLAHSQDPKYTRVLQVRPGGVGVPILS